MSDDPLRQLQQHIQRAMASAHQVDAQLESVASAAMVGACRGAYEALAALLESLRPRPAQAPASAAPARPAPVNERPFQINDVVEYEVSSGFWRRATIRSVHLLHLYKPEGERAFSLEWERGYVEALESECRRPGERRG